MEYVNTSRYKKGTKYCDSDQSNYSSPTNTREDDKSYSQINYGKNNSMVKLSAVKLDESKTETLPTITQLQSITVNTTTENADNKSTKNLPSEKNPPKSKIKLILLVTGMVVLATASSAITAIILKQNFDTQLSEIRENIVSITTDMAQVNSWSAWSDWGECSATCAGGMRTRTRTCDGGANNGSQGYCVGTDVDSSLCNTDTCMGNTWSTWSNWGACSASCNGGMRTRTRTCDGEDRNGSQGACVGNDVDITFCVTDACGVQWDNWAEWGDCYMDCTGSGHGRVQRRTRVTSDSINRKSDSETRPCNAIQFAGCVTESNDQNDNYGVMYDFADQLAQATCTAILSGSGFVNAVRRDCGGGTSCFKICTSVGSTCFNALHVYRDSPYLNVLHRTDVGKKGLQMFKYDDCAASYCGPDFCCCTHSIHDV